MSERESLGKQLLQRNNERALLFEKIRIQQSILSKGDFHYNQRLEDIHLLKLEGSDPGKYQLIQKIQALQKRLIAKTQELEERELLLQGASHGAVVRAGTPLTEAADLNTAVPCSTPVLGTSF
ncbi:hypothetical protein GOODEAATRI_027113 [Goodea atripinnis]|uniref:Cilia- and flagella-associated protein 58 central coiled coil domain-containing protein n=1 Tax=Goodea atripinnis TaxID=208336 RepID=A0ABV0MVJ7_9TELE